MTTVPELLRQAADVITEAGWSQGKTIHPDTGAVCADGAMRVAAGAWREPDLFDGQWRLSGHDHPITLALFNKTLNQAHRALDAYFEQTGQTLPDHHEETSGLPKMVLFNDRVAENPKQVQQAFRDAADWIEQHPSDFLTKIEREILVSV